MNSFSINSLPKEFVERMNKLYGDNWNLNYDSSTHRGLRVNTIKSSKEHLLPLIESWHPEKTTFCPDGFYVDADLKVGAHPLHHAGAFYMQEPSAMSAVTVLDPKPEEKILDLCAAPGGKSTQIASALQGTGLLWCNEYVKTRAHILCQNLERTGVTNSIVTSLDTKVLCNELTQFFDAVLIDAPCSGEGMFRKEPAALEHWSMENINLCAERGSEILDNAAKCIRPGGRLVFSTCTFAPEENECQITSFLKRHPNFELLSITNDFGRPGFPIEKIKEYATQPIDSDCDTTKCLRIFPEDGGEGHFIALLKRSAEDWAAPPVDQLFPKQKGDCKKELLEWLTKLPEGEYICIHDTWRVLPREYYHPSSLPILSAGVPVAEIKKNRLEPTHALFMAFGHLAKQQVHLQNTSKEAHAFIHGESIPCEYSNGYAAVMIDDICVGFGKATNGTLKNHYPKGLRTL